MHSSAGTATRESAHDLLQAIAARDHRRDLDVVPAGVRYALRVGTRVLREHERVHLADDREARSGSGTAEMALESRRLGYAPHQRLTR